MSWERGSGFLAYYFSIIEGGTGETGVGVSSGFLTTSIIDD